MCMDCDEKAPEQLSVDKTDVIIADVFETQFFMPNRIMEYVCCPNFTHFDSSTTQHQIVNYVVIYCAVTSSGRPERR